MKVAFLYFEDMAIDVLHHMAQDLNALGKMHGYQFIITNQKLDSIPKEELLKAIEDIKKS